MCCKGWGGGLINLEHFFRESNFLTITIYFLKKNVLLNYLNEHSCLISFSVPNPIPCSKLYTRVLRAYGASPLGLDLPLF